MRSSFSIVTAIALALSSVGFADNLFQHVLRAYPKGTAGCAANAEELGKRFGEAAKVEIYSSTVTAETSTGCEISIAYFSNEKSATNASHEKISYINPYRGVYATLADCNGALPFEKDLFERQTGLSAWVNYCYLEETASMQRRPYVPVVEGIGAGIKNLYYTDTMMDGIPTEGTVNAMKAIRDGAERLGYGVASVSSAPYLSASDYELLVRLYAKERVWLHATNFASSNQLQVCADQLVDLKQAFVQKSDLALALYCVRNSSANFGLQIVSVSNDPIQLGYRGVADPKFYGSLAECRKAIPATETLYHEKLSREVIGSVCQPAAGNRFQVLLFEKKAITPDR